MKNVLDLSPLAIPGENMPNAILSLLVKVAADLETLDLRLDQLQRGQEPDEEDLYFGYRHKMFERLRDDLLVKFGD